MERAERAERIVAICKELRQSALSCVLSADTISQNAQRPAEDLQIIAGTIRLNMDDMRSQLTELHVLLNAP